MFICDCNFTLKKRKNVTENDDTTKKSKSEVNDITTTPSNGM